MDVTQPIRRLTLSAFKEMFNANALDWLSLQLSDTWPNYDAEKLAALVLPQLPQLEFKARIEAYAQGLLHTAPLSLAAFAEHLPAMLGDIPPAGDGTDFGDFRWAILLRVVSLIGAENIPLALACLAQLTLRFSAEFDIRYFLQDAPALSLAFCLELTQSSDWRLRRLASEGSRPRLPWGMRLTAMVQNPRLTWAILENLRFDPILAVRRSVANHCNDIAKDHPDWLVEQLRRWQQEGVEISLLRHALRGLIKAGHQGALAIFAIQSDFKVQVIALNCPAQVAIGDILLFNYVLIPQQDGLVWIDYVLILPNKQGKTRRKVYKGIKRDAVQNTHLIATGQISFKPVTVRVYYAGLAKLILLLNGQEIATVDFHLTD